ncbi:hypothetical protein ACFQYP_03310 [Nonomuraea antimicrobica]
MGEPGRAPLRHRRPGGALGDLTRAIDLQPQADLYANRAVALHALGRHAEAAADDHRAAGLS